MFSAYTRPTCPTKTAPWRWGTRGGGGSKAPLRKGASISPPSPSPNQRQPLHAPLLSLTAFWRLLRSPPQEVYSLFIEMFARLKNRTSAAFAAACDLLRVVAEVGARGGEGVLC